MIAEVVIRFFFRSDNGGFHDTEFPSNLQQATSILWSVHLSMGKTKKPSGVGGTEHHLFAVCDFESGAGSKWPAGRPPASRCHDPRGGRFASLGLVRPAMLCRFFPNTALKSNFFYRHSAPGTDIIRGTADSYIWSLVIVVVCLVLLV